MINRIAEKEALRLSGQYPVLTIVGPRQSGKTTLCRKVFKEHKYVSLENLDDRNLAFNDAKSFLERYTTPVIIDEIQRVPSLLSYIQTRVDDSKQNSGYVLTGSQQFFSSRRVSSVGLCVGRDSARRFNVLIPNYI